MRRLKEEKNRSFDGYHELRERSVTELENFWASVWEHFGPNVSKPYEKCSPSARRQINLLNSEG